MRLRKAGKITDNLWRLGTEESCVYLLEGSKKSAIISGGMNYIAPIMLRQFKEFGIAEEKITDIIILHAHFDHLGIIPFFKRRWPHVNVYASKRGWEVTANPKAIAVINQFSDLVTKRVFGEKNEMVGLDWEWRDDVKGTPLSDGSSIDLGDMNIDIYETPGHSSCSISVYVPQIQALFPSDAAGIPYKDEIIVVGNSNFTQYQLSLEKLKNLSVNILCGDHYSHIIGEEAQNYIRTSIDAARDMRNLLEQTLKKEGSPDQVAKKLVDEHYRKNPEYFLAPEIMVGVYRQMLKHIAST